MNPDRQAFLDAIAITPEDLTTRRIFADWLDDHDCPEEADKHRMWTEEYQNSVDWIKRFADRIDQTYNRLMQAAERWDDGGDYTNSGENEGYKDATHEEWKEFWNHYRIVMAREPQRPEGWFFSCSC